jgi:hypothetical protein
MIKSVFFLLFVSIFFWACTPNAVVNPNTPYNYAQHDSIDGKVIDTFIQHHPILAGISLNHVVTSTTGLRYQIVLDTGKIAPNKNSNVTFSYSLRIPGVAGTNGIIDSVPSVLSNVGYNVNPLSNTISGLVEGIQYIHNGGHILLFIPSALGFQDQSVNFSYLQGNQTTVLYTVPPNSVLVYNLNLTSVLAF